MTEPAPSRPILATDPPPDPTLPGEAVTDPPVDAADDSPYRRALAGPAGAGGTTGRDTGRSTAAAAEARAGQRDGGGTDDPGWERRLIADLAREALVERRRSRRWRIGLVLGSLAAVLLVAGAVYSWFSGVLEPAAGRHTALIELQGVIDAGGPVEADSVVSSLQAAFSDRNTAGIVLRINSPGGSPVQAGIIHDEIRRLRQLHPTIPVHAVVEDVCASGGYYVAAAADRIFVNKASLVGSIGVVIAGFGFTGLMDKAGVDRRMLTAGRNKGFLDPFSPLSAEQQAHAQTMLDEIHRQFIAVVREGRGERLRETPDLFSGAVWTGQRGIELGLADELGSVDTVARDVIKADDVVDFTARDSLVERVSRRLGATTGEAIANRLDATSLPLRLR